MMRRPHFIFAVVAGMVTAGAGAWPAAAQQKPAPANTAAKPAAQAANKSYIAGVKAFDSGKVGPAVSSLSAALRQGGLPPQKMAKALFYRGTAYRKQGKPAQAISDLTSAVWIKGGLSDADRLAAIEQRKAAYKEAGLGTSVPKGLKPGGGVPSTAVAKAVPVATPSTGTATSAWSTTAQTAPPPKATPARTPAPVATSAPPTTPPTTPATTLSAMPRPATGQQSTTATPDGVGTTLNTIGSSISQGVSSVGSFFGNMFASNNSGSASTSGTPSTSQIATSSTTTAPAPQPSANPAPAVTQGWGPATRSSSSQQRVRTAALAPPAKKPVPAKAAKPVTGKFQLQVAAVRSEAKAQQIVTQLQSKHAAQLLGAKPSIDATAIGNMGTFYRVRVGPFADTKKPRGLCAKLKNDGFDCLIVTP